MFCCLFVFQLVILCYLFDNDTSWMILISNSIGLLIEVWKLRKAVRFSLGPASSRWKPWSALRVEPVHKTYAKSATAGHDKTATDHLFFVIWPLVLGYSGYSLVHNQHKSWMSWFLGSLTGFIYAFGFVMMTPQLYINYKLKSVAHLPWRAMVYKSLNTFVDDLFAFVIKMPTLHRIACFRDDLIFFVYLYQRWAYRTDYTRANEYGQGGTEEEDPAATDAMLDAAPQQQVIAPSPEQATGEVQSAINRRSRAKRERTKEQCT